MYEKRDDRRALHANAAIHDTTSSRCRVREGDGADADVFKPTEHEETTRVVPLKQSLELVHIGDTIQCMVQVFFGKVLVSVIFRTKDSHGLFYPLDPTH